jgi:mannan endo-1,6-alpha-mannosidase
VLSLTFNSLYEFACEPENVCNNDQFSFKAYMSRWLAKSAIVAPYIMSEVRTLLTRSASAAAQSCSGGADGVTCGSKWYINGYDGSYGVGQQLSALETIQSLLLLNHAANGSHIYPMHGSDVKVSAQTPTSTFSVSPPTRTASSPPGTASEAGANIRLRASLDHSTAWPMLIPPVIALLFGAGVLGMGR